MKKLTILILVIVAVGIFGFSYKTNHAPARTEFYVFVFHPRSQSNVFIHYGSEHETENIPFKFKTSAFNGIIDTLHDLNEKGYTLFSTFSSDFGETYTMKKSQ